MKKVVKQANSDTFNLSISDLMAGLLAIFILILCYYILSFNAMKNNYELVKNEYEGNTQLRKEMLLKLKERLREEKINVFIEEDKGVLHLPEKSVLFESGSHETNAEGKEVIKKLGRAIYDTINEPDTNYRNKIGTIFIEGHTDDVRHWDSTEESTSKFDNYNWSLSTRRAIYTWEVMSQATPELVTFKNYEQEPVFSCSGYGPTRPIDLDYKESSNENEIKESREKNRRIDIRFTMLLPNEDSDNVLQKTNINKTIEGKTKNE